ncbi:MAG: diguanylate cyclase domain-containing protein [Candidatus Izemoplasmataceae bacterium]
MEKWFELPLIILLAWAFLVLIKKHRTKKGDLDVFVLVVTTGLYIVFYQLELATLPPYVFEGMLYGGFVYSLFMFDLKGVMKRDLEHEKLNTLKKEYKQLANRSEMLRKRFISMLDLLEDGVLFRMEDGSMFMTDVARAYLGFDSNELAYDDFLNGIHPDDLEAYKALSERKAHKKGHYTAHYRVVKHHQTHWVKEKGVQVEHEKRTMTIALVQSLDVKKYPKTNVEVLNQLQIDQALFEYLQSRNSEEKPYTLLYFELSNIPHINREYGRDIGDLMMGEFISKLIYHFIGDAKAVFRITGIRFAMVIRDQRKYGMLKRALEEGGDLVNYTMSFGGVRESVYPYFGIHTVTVFEEPVDEIAARAEKALTIALDDTTQENYFVIG